MKYREKYGAVLNKTEAKIHPFFGWIFCVKSGLALVCYHATLAYCIVTEFSRTKLSNTEIL